MRWPLLLIPLVPATLLGACLDFASVSTAEPSDASAGSGAGPLAHTPFSCLDDDPGDAGLLSTYQMKVVFYDLAATRSGNTTTSIAGFDYAPVAGAPVKTCFPLDDTCSTPEQTLTADAAGTVTISIREGMSIYLDAEAPGYLPTLFFPPSYVRSTDQAFLVGVLTPSQFAGAAESAGVDMSRSIGPDASLGNIVGYTFDCRRALAANVAWAIDNPDGSTPAYVAGGLISTTATATSTEGTALFYNAGLRTTRVTAAYGDSGVVLQSQNVVVRKGAQTLVFTWP